VAKKVIRMESNVELQDIPQQAPEAITAGDPQEKDRRHNRIACGAYQITY
jgi:hypothetical protein